MKLKLIGGLVVLLLIVGAVNFVRKTKDHAALEKTDSTAQVPTGDSSQSANPASQATAAASSSPAVGSGQGIERKISQIEEAKLTYEAAHLPEITVYLSDVDASVRDSALDALAQMGLSEAVPALKNAAESTQDPEFRKKCETLAEFLTLPTTELPSSKVKHQDAAAHEDGDPGADKKRRIFNASRKRAQDGHPSIPHEEGQ